MKIQPKALSFDLDDTLWPCDDVIDRAESALYGWLEQHFPAIPARYSLEDMRRTRQDAAQRDPALAVDLSRLRVETLRRHAREAGYSEGMAEAGLDVFMTERQRVNLYPEVRAVLERLRRDFPLVALTNGNACVQRVGLGEFFAVSLSAADVGAAKPDPAMFRAACTELALRPGDLLHVGDDPLRDVHAARSVGARAVWLNRTAMTWPEGLRRAHHEMEDLEALPALLADANRRR